MSAPVVAMHLLVSTTRLGLSAFLCAQLDKIQYEVMIVEPGAAFIKAVHSSRPDIVVLDLEPRHFDTARMEVACVKQTRPEARIIVVAQASTPGDAQIIEAGIFFYLVTQTQQPRNLLRVIKSATQHLAAK